MRTSVVAMMLVACGATERAMPDAPDVSVDGATQVMTFVYAHTARTLYRIDPDLLTVTRVGDFSTGEAISDIAIDRSGLMVGVSFTTVYRIDPTDATTTMLSAAPTGMINGLSFVPAESFGQVGDDVLIATRNADGAVFRIEPTTGAVKQIGSTGTYRSSGDIVSVAGFGTLLTTENGAAADSLVRLAPQSFAATPIGDTGFDRIWGVAYWKTRVFGFTNAGQFIAIDPRDGSSTLIATTGQAWNGAAVITTAPVLY